MNPLSELKERLVYISVAGTQLLSEDFRLKKAIEAMEPLSKKNPVFQKIYIDAEKLLSAEKEQQSVLLLNLLGLVDAVLYTQASTTIEGDLTELPETQTAGNMIQMRYSAIHPLLQALTTKGSGRMEVLDQTLYNHPEYFTDYRVLHALIHDLNDSYGEMADEVFSILKALGTGEAIKKYIPSAEYQYTYSNYLKDFYLPKVDPSQLVAQLKQDFDPDGKRDMEKRVALIGMIAKESENDWYISLLDKKKGIREAAITALGYSKENIPLLLELAKKSKSKEVIYQALSKWDISELCEFWVQEFDQSIAVAPHLKSLTSDALSDVVAEKLQTFLEGLIGKKELTSKENDMLNLLMCATVNKTSDKMMQVYQWILDHSEKLPEVRVYRYAQYQLDILKLLEKSIAQTLIVHFPEKLIAFLQSLNKKQQAKIPYDCFLADIFTLSSRAFYEKWADAKAHKRLEEYFANNTTVNGMTYADGVYQVVMHGYHFESSMYDDDIKVSRETKEPLDLRWYDLFVQMNWDQVLIQLTPENNDAVCAKVGKYFYDKLRKPTQKQFALHDVLSSLHMLHDLGWKEFQDLIFAQCQKYQSIQEWHILVMLQAYQSCVDADTVSREANNILDYYSKQKSKKIFVDILKDNFIQKGMLK